MYKWSLMIFAFFPILFVACGEKTTGEDDPEVLPDLLDNWERSDGSISESLLLRSGTTDSLFRFNRDSSDGAGGKVGIFEASGSWNYLDTNLVFVADECFTYDQPTELKDCYMLAPTSFVIVEDTLTLTQYDAAYDSQGEVRWDTTIVRAFIRK